MRIPIRQADEPLGVKLEEQHGRRNQRALVACDNSEQPSSPGAVGGQLEGVS
jgi:hypothetical protein